MRIGICNFSPALIVEICENYPAYNHMMCEAYAMMLYDEAAVGIMPTYSFDAFEKLMMDEYNRLKDQRFGL